MMDQKQNFLHSLAMTDTLWIIITLSRQSELLGQSTLLLVHHHRGIIPGGQGVCGPPTFGQQHFFRGFSHTTDRKVPSEVVLMGSFMSVIYGNVR